MNMRTISSKSKRKARAIIIIYSLMTMMAGFHHMSLAGEQEGPVAILCDVHKKVTKLNWE